MVYWTSHPKFITVMKPVSRWMEPGLKYCPPGGPNIFTNRPPVPETTLLYWPASMQLGRTFHHLFLPSIFPEAHILKEDPPMLSMANLRRGTSTGDLFQRWFEHFLRHARKERPLLLNFDGHKSHLAPEVIEAAKREDVLLCLPPHCSHVLQPLDVGFFGLLKAEFAKVAANLCHFKNSYIVNKTVCQSFQPPVPAAEIPGHCGGGIQKVWHLSSESTCCGFKPPHALHQTQEQHHHTRASNIVNLLSRDGLSKPPIRPTIHPTTPQPSAPLDHPLVEAGLIQPDLAEVLTRVDYRKKIIRHIPVEARVITGEEYERLLRQKEDSARVAEEAKEQRAQRKRARTTKGPTAGAANTCSDPATASGTTPSCTSSASTPSTSAGASSSSSSSSSRLAAETIGEKRKLRHRRQVTYS
ncbi:uncharacterized protein [Hoplias malabaricus]|uniref:uncharacterized protein n=1 Tax=Hoplias malabaricus TaxID=27720 RepID=UPI0034625588